MKNTVLRWTATLIVLLLTSLSWAEDVVVLKDGTRYEGEILLNDADMIRIRIKFGTMTRTYTVWRDEIESIILDGEGTDDDAANTEVDTTPDQASPQGEEADAIADDLDLRNKKVFVIPMHGEVGVYFSKAKLEEAVNAGRKYNPDVIVLEIESPGGFLFEVYELRDYIQEIREEFRVVVWIKSAISAAAMTAFNSSEMYFRREGHIGAATAWYMTSGGAKSMEGAELQEWLGRARALFESAGYNSYIAQAMIIKDYVLSCDIRILPNGEREVIWYDNDQGEYLVCRDDEVLTLTASQALKYGISLGTADDGDELAQFLNLDAWVEVSGDGRKIMEKWWALCKKAEKEIPTLVRKRNMAMAAGDRASIGEAIGITRKLIQWCDRVEIVARMSGVEKRNEQRTLRRLIAQLRG